MDSDYRKELHIGAAPQTVFDALTTLAGCASWWAPASGSPAPGGELRFTFDDPGAPLVLHVAEADRPAAVAWQVRACDFLPDWVGTAITFVLTPAADGCELRFRHVGLRPQLDCYDQCRAGWDYFLPSLRDYAESGAGRPYRRSS
jgi:uncharacterized protein YndB with AHSA1/START domain